MISTSPSLLFTLFSFLALFTTLALAAPLSRHHAHATPNSTVLAKRYSNTRLTYYDAGENACGSVDADTAYVSHLNKCSH